MVSFCSLRACPSRNVTSTSKCKIRKHMLPAGSDPAQRRLWEQFIDRGNRTSTPDGTRKRIKLCSEHFEPHFLTGKGNLESNAVPTIFPLFTAQVAHRHGLIPQVHADYLQYINNFALDTEECRAALVKHVQVQSIQPTDWIGDSSSHHCNNTFPNLVDIPPTVQHVGKMLTHIDGEWIDGDLFLPLNESFGDGVYETSSTHAEKTADPSLYNIGQMSAGNNISLGSEGAPGTSCASLLKANHEGTEEPLITRSFTTAQTLRGHSVNDITLDVVASSTPSDKTRCNVITKDHLSLRHKLKMLQMKMRQAKKQVEDLKFLLSNLEQERLRDVEKADLINLISPELDKIIWCMMEDKEEGLPAQEQTF